MESISSFGKHNAQHLTAKPAAQMVIQQGYSQLYRHYMTNSACFEMFSEIALLSKQQQKWLQYKTYNIQIQ